VQGHSFSNSLWDNPPQDICQRGNASPKITTATSPPRKFVDLILTQFETLPVYNGKILTNQDLESGGLQKCLKTCYGFGGRCTDKNSCGLKVHCFHDHCYCDVSLKCAADNLIYPKVCAFQCLQCYFCCCFCSCCYYRFCRCYYTFPCCLLLKKHM
jgi:hypothetical protein